VSADLRLLDLANPEWQDFDPKDRKVGPVEYPDDLTGSVQWLRAYAEGMVPTESGEVGLSICHMEGDPTEAFEDKTNDETEIMVLLEGSGTAKLPDGSTFEVQAPHIVYAPRGLTYSWTYTTPYRGVYIIIW
jgi:mannose-6-phosphate isomerase-like protein (cupin superfamily)